jgi:hypothetical protein
MLEVVAQGSSAKAFEGKQGYRILVKKPRIIPGFS